MIATTRSVAVWPRKSRPSYAEPRLTPRGSMASTPPGVSGDVAEKEMWRAEVGVDHPPVVRGWSKDQTLEVRIGFDASHPPNDVSNEEDFVIYRVQHFATPQTTPPAACALPAAHSAPADLHAQSMFKTSRAYSAVARRHGPCRSEGLMRIALVI